MNKQVEINDNTADEAAGIALALGKLKAGYPNDGLTSGVDIVKRLLAHMEDNTTDIADEVFFEDPDCFINQEQFEKEKSWLMNDMLHPLALSCDLPKPNSFYTTKVMDVPILITRDANGKIHAFINTCLHRGSALKMEDCGSASRLSCPYHGWTYTLEGKLAGIPESQHFSGCGVDRGDQLTTLPVVEEAGIIHVGLTPDTPKIFEAQKGLSDILAPMKFEDWSLFNRRSWWTGNFNWKLGVDTFLETYHVQYLHKDTIATYLNSGVVAYDDWDYCSRMSIPAQSIDALRMIPESEWHPADHLTVMFHHYPSTTITLQGCVLSVVQIFPGDTPSTCQIQHSVYMPHEITNDDEKAFCSNICDVINSSVLDKEDFLMSETVSDSAKAQSLKTIVFGRNEPNLQTFHKGIREMMKT